MERVVRVEIGRKLKEARHEKGLTQKQLAAKVGYSDRTVAAWEANERHPRGIALARLAQALGVSVADLYAEPDQKAA